MRTAYYCVLLSLLLTGVVVECVSPYEPNWASLDKRPIAKWFDEEKFGIFMHWGVWSVPSFGTEGAHEAAFFWEYLNKKNLVVAEFMKKNYPPDFTYADFASSFTAEFFDGKVFAEIIKASGAKYFVFTSKHEEGFANYPSKYAWNWNSMDVGPHRDIVGELKKGFEGVGGVHFGLYYCLYDVYNPIYLSDANNHFTTQEYVRMVTQPMLTEIVEKYQPEIIWTDGEWLANYKYWNSTNFLTWLFNDSPIKGTVVINDRWGQVRRQHGGVYTVEGPATKGWLHNHKWEHCTTLDRMSWGFRRQMTAGDVLSVKEVVALLARTISCGGNLLLNVGPTHDGRIVPLFEERLREVGVWVSANAPAIYHTKPWIFQNDSHTPHIWYTSSMRDDSALDPYRLWNPQQKDNTVVYAFLTQWPANGILKLTGMGATGATKVRLLGGRGGRLKWKGVAGGLSVDFRALQFQDLPSTHAWVLQLQYLQDDARTPYIGPF